MAAAIGTGSTRKGPPLLQLGTIALVFTTLVAVGLAAVMLSAGGAVRIDPAVSLRAV